VVATRRVGFGESGESLESDERRFEYLVVEAMKMAELPDHLRRFGQQRLNELVQQQVDKVQSVYDRVLDAGRGQSLEEVKALLAQEWRSEFGAELTESKLSEQAAPLAEGRRIVVKTKMTRSLQS
jgi:hypothetical protein